MDEKQVQALKAQSKLVSASCVNASLRRATRAVTQRYDQILAPSGLLITQFTLLVACAIAGPAPISALAEALIMDRTTLARNLKPLKAQGLVQIAEGRDRRVSFVSLSEKGYAVLAEAIPLWEEAQAQMAAGFGGPSLQHLLDDLTRMVAVTRNQ